MLVGGGRSPRQAPRRLRLYCAACRPGKKRSQDRELRRKLIHVNVGFDPDGSKIVICQSADA
jgi:hypothetical protein